ncbi:MAG: YgfZ/GcvT domain-containing protein [Leptolyngbyaceae cyanobacterium]
MNQLLRDCQLQMGALFAPDDLVPLSFGNDGVALQAARQGVALCDRSHWGRVEVGGSDRQAFLHNQSTNNLNGLQPGEGCDTVFVTPTARTIDLATAYVMDQDILAVLSPNRKDYLLTWLDHYIFFGDKVTLTDVTNQTALFSLIGPESRALFAQLGISLDPEAPTASHSLVQLAGQPVRLAVGSGLGLTGYTLMMAAEQAATVWSALAQAGAVPLGERVWEQLRIEQGRPRPDRELTEDYNPLEAGLWHAVSFNKGCYIGQETIARLDAYKGVKQQLWGIRLEGKPELGQPITQGEEKIGVLTSLTESENGPIGLAYIRTKAGGAGLTVTVDGNPGVVVEVPFLTREKAEPKPDL